MAKGGERPGPSTLAFSSGPALTEINASLIYFSIEFCSDSIPNNEINDYSDNIANNM